MTDPADADWWEHPTLIDVTEPQYLAVLCMREVITQVTAARDLVARDPKFGDSIRLSAYDEVLKMLQATITRWGVPMDRVKQEPGNPELWR